MAGNGNCYTIASISFGMAIDCPDILHILHWVVLSVLEEYFQETGRAGHDGKDACSGNFVFVRGEGREWDNILQKRSKFMLTIARNAEESIISGFYLSFFCANEMNITAML